MPSVTLCLVFGEDGDAACWASLYETEEYPEPGSVLRLQLSTEDSVFSQVMLTLEGDNDGVLVLLYGGPEQPDDEVTAALSHGWNQMPDEVAHTLLHMCETAPMTAQTHDAVLVCGDPATGEVEVWERMMEPIDPLVPLFGQRLVLDALDVLPDERARTADELPEPDPTSSATLTDGIPVVVVSGMLMAPGFAEVVFWTRDLGEVSGADLTACDWSQVSVPDDFDPDEMQLSERVALALRTRFGWAPADEEDVVVLDEYTLEGAEDVEERLYALLPDELVEYCRMRRDLANISDIVAGWSEHPDDPAAPERR